MELEHTFFRYSIDNEESLAHSGDKRYNLLLYDAELAREVGKTLLDHVQAAKAETVDAFLILQTHTVSGEAFIRAPYPGEGSSIGTIMTRHETESFAGILETSQYPRVRKLGGVVAEQLHADQEFDQIVSSFDS